MNKRFLRQVLTFCALALPLAAGAQSAPRKPARTNTSTRPATTTARPVPAPQAQATTAASDAVAAPTAVAPTPAPAPAPAPARVDAPAAGPQGEHIRAGVIAGLAAPMSSLGKAFSAGFNAGGYIQGRPAGFPVGLRGDLQYARFSGKNAVVTPSFSVVQLTGAGVYDFPAAGGGKSPFFATAGLGLYRTSANSESQTDFGQNLGLGFNFRTTKLHPFVEGRFHFFNDVQYFTLSAAVRF